MKHFDTKVDDTKEEIIRILIDRLPNSIRIRKIREALLKNTKLKVTQETIDKALDSLVADNTIKIEVRDNPQLKNNVRRELQKRESISLTNPPEAPIKGEYQVGETSVVRLLALDKLSPEDVNEVTEALKEYIDHIDKTFDERVQRKTAEIYKQMIGIFGVFVSIFSIIVISTDKMLRFDPNILEQDWRVLLLKSSMLFLPVGIIIGSLMWVVLRGIKK